MATQFARLEFELLTNPSYFFLLSPTKIYKNFDVQMGGYLGVSINQGLVRAIEYSAKFLWQECSIPQKAPMLPMAHKAWRFTYGTDG
jgi:hypothetical protein